MFMEQCNSINYLIEIDDLQSYKDYNNILDKLDINISIYPAELCEFVDMICHKYSIKHNRKTYDTILDFMIQIEKDCKNKQILKKKQSKYIKEYQEIIMSLKSSTKNERCNKNII